MKGFVLRGKGDAAWQDVAPPIMTSCDAIVRPTAVAVCTTDLHLIKTAAWPNAIGKVLGHEAVGIVEAIGEDVRDFAPGDRVVIPSAGTNWRHPRAQRGEAKFHQEFNTYFSSDPQVNGVFSERVRVIDADMRLARIPDSVSDVQALMVPDMVATGFSGIDELHLKYGETVLILGVGPVGLMGCAAAALGGAGRIIAVGSRPKTLELAERYGATNLVDYKKGDVLAQVMELTGGEPVDGVLIASGGAPDRIFTTAMRAVKFGGNVACVSLFFDEESVTLPLDVWMQGGMEKRLTGVLCNDGRDFFERLLALIRFKRLDPAPLATHVLRGWQRLEDGLRLMASRDPSVLKAVVVP